MTDPVRPQNDSDDERDSERSGVWRTLGIGALVIIVVLVFLLLWDPFGESRTATDTGRHPGIVGVLDDLSPSDDYIGAWLKPGKDIEAVLRRHGLSEDAVIFRQEKDGYYVITAGERDVADVVKDLKADSALYDAGRVYEEDAPETP